MRRYPLLVVAAVLLAACSARSLQPAQGTAQAVINQVGPTARAVAEEVAPTLRALVPTAAPTAAPDPQFPSTLDKNLVACFAPRCNAEEAFILTAGTRYRDTKQDDGNWRLVQVPGGGQVWVLRAQLTKG